MINTIQNRISTSKMLWTFESNESEHIRQAIIESAGSDKEDTRKTQQDME